MGRAVEEPPAPNTVHVQCIDYGPERFEKRTVDDLEAFLKEDQPTWAEVRWVNIDGLDPWTVNCLRQTYGIHTLAAEDVLHIPQRPRLEPYDEHLYIATQMLTLQDGMLHAEQVSLFVFDRLVITFQERLGDVWDPIRYRLKDTKNRIRSKDASFLTYALLDAVVDHCFPLLERYSTVLEDIEARIMRDAEPRILQEAQQIRRELSSIRKVLWPTRELLDQFQRDEHPWVSSITQTFLRDVYTHVVQLLDIVETYREVCGTSTELYMSMVSNRMNEVMKTLTIIATLFIPITFLAGVYGMNFEYLPELKWRFAYPVFWGVCATVTVSLLVYFRKKHWL